MLKIASKIIVTGLILATAVVFVPSASAQRPERINRNFNRNFIRTNSFMRNRDFDRNFRVNRNFRINDFDRNRVLGNRRFDRDDFFRHSRFFRNNTVYLGYPYYRYAPFIYYQRYLPNYNDDATFVIVDRDNLSNVLVLGNDAYYGSDYNRVVVIRVSDATFWRIKNAMTGNDFNDFRFDMNSRHLSFRDMLGNYSTNDIDAGMDY